MIISGLCFVYIMQNVCLNPGSNPGPPGCKSEALPTELCGPLSIALLKDVYELNNVSNDIILMIIS